MSSNCPCFLLQLAFLEFTSFESSLLYPPSLGSSPFPIFEGARASNGCSRACLLFSFRFQFLRFFFPPACWFSLSRRKSWLRDSISRPPRLFVAEKSWRITTPSHRGLALGAFFMESVLRQNLLLAQWQWGYFHGGWEAEGQKIGSFCDVIIERPLHLLQQLS